MTGFIFKATPRFFKDAMVSQLPFFIKRLPVFFLKYFFVDKLSDKFVMFWFRGMKIRKDA